MYLLSSALCPLSSVPVMGQEVVDRMVAVVNGRELVTYSDILWQLALEPGRPLSSPKPDDLNDVLQRVIDQRLIAQEAEKLPTINPTDEAINEELKRLIQAFPSQAEFYQRLNQVGLGQDSEQLREIMRQRVVINSYMDFRFRSFTVVTQQEVADYYRDVFVPRFKRESPGRIVPKLEEVQERLEGEIRETKVSSDISAFLEDARSRAEIIYLVKF